MACIRPYSITQSSFPALKSLVLHLFILLFLNSLATMDLFSVSSLFFPECYMIAIIQYVPFSDCFSLTNMPLRFLQVFSWFDSSSYCHRIFYLPIISLWSGDSEIQRRVVTSSRGTMNLWQGWALFAFLSEPVQRGCCDRHYAEAWSLFHHSFISPFGGSRAGHRVEWAWKSVDTHVLWPTSWMC